MFSLEKFYRTYDTERVPVKLNGRTIELLKPASIDRFINADDVMTNFPLWSKLWEASWVLATHLYNLAPDPHKTMLEIGCGLGLVGIAAAMAGHRITMTEIDPDALNFARANAAANGCTEIAVERLDWNDPQLEGRFDYIVGSETIYRNEDIDGLKALFDRYLTPGGTIILAEGVRSTGVVFWQQMHQEYDVKAKRQVLRSDDGDFHVVLFRLKRK
jgi:predicted nicotinamide N-methyase